MYAPLVEEYTITPSNKNKKENKEMSVKFVTEVGAKDIKLRHVTLGDYVVVEGVSKGKVIGIDYNDDMLMVLDGSKDMDIMAKDTIGARVVLLEDYENRTDWMWVDIVDVEQHKIKTPPITVQVAVQPTVQEVKQAKPKRTKLESIKVGLVGCEFIIVDNQHTICIDKCDGNVGISRLHGDDIFNLEIGMALAYWRTFSKGIKTYE